MAYSISEIEGIGPSTTEKLGAAGIKTTDDLLDHCASASGREKTAAATGIDKAKLLKFANMADLMRVNGVGEEYSELLEAGGVDTVKELRHRVPANLHAKLAEVAAEGKVKVRRVPSASECEKWVADAKTLEPKVTH